MSWLRESDALLQLTEILKADKARVDELTFCLQ
jgi:hypothetical protein